MPESYKENGRPAQQWYWGDWFSAFDVRLCSLEARGLWIDMLGIMFQSEVRGTLTINGKKVNSKTLAKITGDTEVKIAKLLQKLEAKNVFSRLENGTIICRRMYRESAKKKGLSKIRSEAGKEGAKKRWQKDGKDMAKMASSSPSSSSSSSSNNKRKEIHKEKKIDYTKEMLQLFEGEFEKYWKSYDPRGQKNKQYAKKRFIALCKTGGLPEFDKGYTGYSNYLKDKRINEGFDQKPKYFSTLISDYKEYIGFKYKPPK